MTLVWDKTAEHFYEIGVDHGVLWPFKEDGSGYDKGVVWNGLTSVNESPEGAEANAQYADNIKYLNLYSAEEFKATIEAFTYPDEFMVCDGSAELDDGVYIGQQTRRMFAFAYRTKLGNDTVGQDYGYKLHIVYGCNAAPSEKAYETINDSPEPITFSWEVNSTPVECPGYNNISTIVIDSTKVSKAALKMIEDKLYGAEGDSELLMPADIIQVLETAKKVETVVTSDVAAKNLYGKQLDDLQTDVSVDDKSMMIKGTLKHVDGYTEFAKDPALQTGNFLALQFTPADPNASVSVFIVGGDNKKPVALKPEEDYSCVFKIKNNTQQIQVNSELESTKVTKTYSLKSLVLEDE